MPAQVIPGRMKPGREDVHVASESIGMETWWRRADPGPAVWVDKSSAAAKQQASRAYEAEQRMW
jgi:hypothetical protein